jgi:hypothetical protein
MALRYYISRIIHDKLKMAMIFVLLVMPSIDIIVILEPLGPVGIEKPVPLFGTFVSMYSIGHMMQSIFFWFLPVYLLLIVSEGSLEDVRTGNKHALVSRLGSKGYFLTKLFGSSLVSFCIVLCALALNLALSLAFFSGGTHNRLGGVLMPENTAFTLAMSHPLAANLAYILAISLLAGAVGGLGTSLAIAIRDKKVVYGIAFLAWLLPIYMHPSLMVAFNPFNEYDFDMKLPLYFGVLAEFVVVIAASYVWEKRIAKI